MENHKEAHTKENHSGRSNGGKNAAIGLLKHQPHANDRRRKIKNI